MSTIVSLISPKLLELDFQFSTRLCIGNVESEWMHKKIFHKSGRGLGHVTHTIFGIRSNISSKIHELLTSNLVCGFVLPLLYDYWVLHTIVYCEAVQSAILVTAWLLVQLQFSFSINFAVFTARCT